MPVRTGRAASGVASFVPTLRPALIDATPEAAEDPVVGCGSPASTPRLWMCSLNTMKQIDMVLLRVNVYYVDPLDLLSDSRPGVVGLVECCSAGW
ncbi:hypothetical protein [Mycobacterium lepromatosis]|uniref:hypothetical protein n=1 Tax=Mycobacterium lepromatosis TaxID=480418 RepID=UPI001F2706C4|nr:hypothetical protein [Mycobacterium lepromatosis]